MSNNMSNASEPTSDATPPDVIDLTGLTLDELRDARRRIEAEERELSFVRRVLQGRIDILRAELRRRTVGGDGVIGQLRSILSDSPGTARPTRRQSTVDGHITRSRIAIAADQASESAAALDLAVVTDDQIKATIDSLVAHENAVSHARQLAHLRLDRMGGELTRRYREGSAQVDDLLAAARRK